jgi:hypothetical protein
MYSAHTVYVHSYLPVEATSVVPNIGGSATRCDASAGGMEMVKSGQKLTTGRTQRRCNVLFGFNCFGFPLPGNIIGLHKCPRTSAALAVDLTMNGIVQHLEP